MKAQWTWLGCFLALLTLVSPARGSCLEQGQPCCDYCRMFLQHDNFGGEMIQADKTRLTFDATECMAAYWITQGSDTTRIRSIRSRLFARPGQGSDGRRAWYLLSDSILSPMGVGLAAYASSADAQAAQRKHGGRLLRWNQVVAFIRDKWQLAPKR